MLAYDPETPLPPREWLALTRRQRKHLIADYLRRQRPEFKGMRRHPGILAAIETQYALGLPPVREAFLWDQREGTGRFSCLMKYAWLLMLTFEESADESPREFYRRYATQLTGFRAPVPTDNFPASAHKT